MGHPTRRGNSSDDNNSSRTSDLRLLLDESASIWLSLTWIAVPIACLLLAGVSVFMLLSERRTVHQQDVLAQQTPPVQAAAPAEKTSLNETPVVNLNQLVKQSVREALQESEVSEKLKITNDHFNAVLVKSIQELSAKVEALEAKLEANG